MYLDYYDIVAGSWHSDFRSWIFLDGCGLRMRSNYMYADAIKIKERWQRMNINFINVCIL